MSFEYYFPKAPVLFPPKPEKMMDVLDDLRKELKECNIMLKKLNKRSNNGCMGYWDLKAMNDIEHK
jgi:hypothetical protein